MNPVLSYGGNVCCTGTAVQAGAFDQRRMEAREDILVYTSEPFKEGTEVSGPITPTLYVSSDAKDTDFTVKVLDVYPDGRAFNLDESIQRMRYRDGYDKPLAWMESGKVYKVDAAAADDEQLLRGGPQAAHRGVEQQLPALRSQPEHRRQQLRREQRRRRAQRRAPLEAVPVVGDGDGDQKSVDELSGRTIGGRGWTGRTGWSTKAVPAFPADPARPAYSYRSASIASISVARRAGA